MMLDYSKPFNRQVKAKVAAAMTSEGEKNPRRRHSIHTASKLSWATLGSRLRDLVYEVLVYAKKVRFLVLMDSQRFFGELGMDPSVDLQG